MASLPDLDGQIHVWRARITTSAVVYDILRGVLSRYAGAPAGALTFEFGPNGKPSLSMKNGPRFNLSHSGGLLLIAVARDAELGVDVEAIAPVEDSDDVAAQFLNDADRRAIAAASPADRPRVFITAWVKKEAAIKVTGGSLADTGRPDWIRDVFEPEPGYIAALACSRALEIRHFTWESEVA